MDLNDHYKHQHEAVSFKKESVLYSEGNRTKYWVILFRKLGGFSLWTCHLEVDWYGFFYGWWWWLKNGLLSADESICSLLQLLLYLQLFNICKVLNWALWYFPSYTVGTRCLDTLYKKKPKPFSHYLTLNQTKLFLFYVS